MQVNNQIFRELIKRGYSIKGDIKSWDISDSKLWYLTPELAEGFLSLKNYEPYRMKVIDTEFEIIDKHSQEINKLLGECSFNLIDLGCGDGRKAAEIIKRLPKNCKMRYCAVDISQLYIEKAIAEVKNVNSPCLKEIKFFTSDFSHLNNVIEMVKSDEYPRNVVLFLGETISHYEVNGLLYVISEAMLEGDVIIIGNGYKVTERFVELDKYKDKLFDDWFFNLMKGLGFNSDEVSYDARFENGRLEFYYKIKKDRMIESEGKHVQFKKGDEITVGCQYKYYEKEWKEFLAIYFSNSKIIRDEKKEYAFWICKK